MRSRNHTDDVFLLYFVHLTEVSLFTATLDSAVTVADYGAKKFLMRDGKDVVQCLYFENVSQENHSTAVDIF